MEFCLVKTAVADLHYFPCIEYFVMLSQFDKIIIDVHENYEKQSYRNRCHILTASKVQSLSVPVQKGNSKQIYRDVKIDYSERWQSIHKRTIETAYGKAPFYEYLAEEFLEILDVRHSYLIDLNSAIMAACFKFIPVAEKVKFSTEYIQPLTEDFMDFRSKIHPKKHFSVNSIYKPFAYHQNFGKEFVPNLSILDLIFCSGKSAAEIVRKSSENFPNNNMLNNVKY